MNEHKFRIRVDAVGHGTVEMDGLPVRCRSVVVRAGVDEATTVTLEVPASEVDVEAEVWTEDARRQA